MYVYKIYNCTQLSIMLTTNQYIACEDGVVRLVGGSQNREGTVEICYFNLWGTVSVSGWDDIDAGVVCYTLDFEREGMYFSLALLLQ